MTDIKWTEIEDDPSTWPPANTLIIWWINPGFKDSEPYHSLCESDWLHDDVESTVWDVTNAGLFETWWRPIGGDETPPEAEQ